MGSENAHLETKRAAVEAWRAAHQLQVQEYFAATYPKLCVPVIEVVYGRRYAKIITRDGDVTSDGSGDNLARLAHGVGSKSVTAFIDLRNGNVLKPAGWKGPAKHARGNVLDVHAGLGSTSAHGVAYLR